VRIPDPRQQGPAAAAVALVVQNSPAVNNSESPGKKNPINRPVSAKSTRNTPAAPRSASQDVALSGFTSATTASPRQHLPYFYTNVEVVWAATRPQPSRWATKTSLPSKTFTFRKPYSCRTLTFVHFGRQGLPHLFEGSLS
jgi:hypothetical protein